MENYHKEEQNEKNLIEQYPDKLGNHQVWLNGELKLSTTFRHRADAKFEALKEMYI